MNTVAGVAVLRGHIERFFWTVDLQWARKLPGYTANNPQSRNDRKPGDEVCIADDELQNLFTHFVAKYHATPHRGLNFRTPNAVWDEMSEGVDFDMSQMPSPGQLREACGFYTKATLCDAGIKFAGAIFRNDFIRDQRKMRQADRISKPGETFEIKVDPFDLGAISVVVDGELISVPCANPEMRGKSLRQWQQEKWFTALLQCPEKVAAMAKPQAVTMLSLPSSDEREVFKDPFPDIFAQTAKALMAGGIDLRAMAIAPFWAQQGPNAPLHVLAAEH